MRTLSRTLNDLILVVEDTLTRPARYQTIVADRKFPDLAAEIRVFDAKPAEHARCTNAAMAIVHLLEAFYASDCEATSPWLSAVGAALPLLRTEAWQALRNEKAQSAPEEYRR
ncbi:hypothetical protein XI06_15260 [Bradyrhizobium sp. CCBAU 11434]|uniref:hypothetical protein n=1 Tax=Bradyrhizobium sp. CCBAU 11434 TaxID=1630885 RepID=UPI0023062D94|nr:hypothetical protein [Bradyrhizobium sp. CCBAU 11434]MDA9521662.1 hypothetical protein [Bradyrhizobium sp. CCBAU 11434]